MQATNTGGALTEWQNGRGWPPGGEPLGEAERRLARCNLEAVLEGSWRQLIRPGPPR